jgi:hypothetical protein
VAVLDGGIVAEKVVGFGADAADEHVVEPGAELVDAFFEARFELRMCQCAISRGGEMRRPGQK